MCNQKLVDTSLIYCTEPKQKPETLKKVSSQSPLCQSGRKREDLWWEGFVKEVQSGHTAFSALTLLVGWQEEHPASKN